MYHNTIAVTTVTTPPNSSNTTTAPVPATTTPPFVFEPSTAPLEVIGKPGRRFFSGYGKSDGVIIAYLPAEKNDGKR